jgi:hypothetical protein
VTPNGHAAVKAVMRIAGRAWTKLAEESTFDSLSSTVLADGRRVTNGLERQTLESREGERVTIRWELGSAVRKPSGEIHAIPGDDALADAIFAGTETIEVPAGKLECRHFRATYFAEGIVGTTDLWLADQVPVPVKSVESNPREVTTTTLMRSEIKPR